MIHEISNFVASLKDENFGEDISLRDEGLYAVIDVDSNDEPIGDSYQSILYRRKEQEKHSDFIVFNNLKMKEYYSECIDANKYLDIGGKGGKKIHSSIPYAIWFKFVNKDYIKERFSNYFNEICALVNNDENKILRVIKIKSFCEEHLFDKLNDDSNYNDLKSTDYVKVFFNFTIGEYIESYNEYLSIKLFNKEDQGKEFGQAIFLNGAPDKKPFMIPRTAAYKTNLRVSKDMAIKLEKFRRLLTNKPNKKLPNPLPIFIDKDELNNEVVKLFNRDKEPLKFHDIIRSIFTNYSDDTISDYYLINWSNTKEGLVINDIDFVPQFIYNLRDFNIYNVVGIKNYDEENEIDIKIENIFHFEKILDQKLFYKIQKNTGYRYGSLMSNYFTDNFNIQTGYELRSVIKRNLLCYRKAIYDYIYKSKIEAISGNMFYDIIFSSIFDDIKSDVKFFNTKYIQEKLNIVFSLNKNFDKQNKNFGGIDMASKIPEFQENMKKLLTDDNYHIQTDNEFAFAAGQLIYYILTKSQTSNKTHSLLEPYITKNDALLFKQTIARGIEQYKHAFDFGSRRFEKLSGEILGYDCCRNIKEMLPILLAGYFSKSIIFEKTTSLNQGE